MYVGGWVTPSITILLNDTALVIPAALTILDILDILDTTQTR